MMEFMDFVIIAAVGGLLGALGSIHQKLKEILAVLHVCAALLDKDEDA